MTKQQMLHHLLPQNLSDEMAFHLSNCLHAFALYFEAHYQAQIQRHFNTLDAEHGCNEKDDFADEIPF